MNQDQATRWKNDALDAIFAGLATSRTLVGRLIFKGARVLNLRLGSDERQSLDIDANLTQAFVEEFPDRVQQRDEIHAEIRVALARHFAEQEVVRYAVTNVAVQFQAKTHHPQGWDAFLVRINLTDFALAGVRGLPALEVDVAAPESLGPHAVARLAVDGHDVNAYTLERIAGEKLRAFLSSLPAYRNKMSRPGEKIRAKDIYDIARIGRVFRLDEPATGSFWHEAASEFRRACASRYVDCPGPEAFAESIDATRVFYETDPTLPKDDIPFDVAWALLERIAQRFVALGVIPFAFPLPTPDDDSRKRSTIE